MSPGARRRGKERPAEPTRRPRTTRRGRVLTALVVAGLTVGGAYGVRAVTGPACTVRLVGGSTVDLSRTQAMAATRHAGDQARDEGENVAGSRSRAVIRALRAGRPALSCSGDRADVRPQEEGESGLTPRAERLLERLRAAFGDVPVGGFAPGGVSTGHMEGSAHYDGRAVDVFFRPVDQANQVRGWVLAQWAVAHADRLRVATVIYDGRIWSSRWPLDHWRPYRPSGGTDDPVLMHRDHVHVDVLG